MILRACTVHGTCDNSYLMNSRLFESKHQPQRFDLAGSIDYHCELDPVSYRTIFQ